MCSINETEQLLLEGKMKSEKGPKQHEKKSGKKYDEEGMCMKCGENAIVLVRNNDPFCKTCFLEYAVHKFRATIGKARVIHQGERVLLAVSGGSSSSAMLDLVVKGLGESAVKKHRFIPGVVHIDDGGICGESEEYRFKIKEHFEIVATNAGFPFHFVSLADLFLFPETNFPIKCCIENGHVLSNTATASNHLQQLFDATTTTTAKEDLLSHLYRKMLLQVAKENGYKYIMVADCATSIAVSILADVAQGRGSQLPFSVSFRDNRSDIAILRPMREFTKKEVQYYNHICDVISFTKPSFSTLASSHASIYRLSQELIYGLQTSFPSTINTVLKTGNKISSTFDREERAHCALCLTPLMVDARFSSVDSKMVGCENGGCGENGKCNTAYSKNSGVCHDTLRDRSDGEGMGRRGATDNAMRNEDHNSIRKVTQKISIVNPNAVDCVPCDALVNDKVNNVLHFEKTFCYGCQLTIKDMKNDMSLLPHFVTENIRQKAQQHTMKEIIKDSLLED